jgi:hypothetical protein
MLYREVESKIKEHSASLEHIETVNINQFPRLTLEMDDAPRLQRAYDYLNGKKGKIKLNQENYYFKTNLV